MRKKQTWAEKTLWRLLRDRRFSGYKFRRQHPFEEYYLDFYCAEARLVLETDGFMHGHPEKQKHDQNRDEFLRSRGITVKRIWNWQLRRQLEWVRLQIWMLLQERAPHPGNMQPARRVTPRVLNPDKQISAELQRKTPHP
jgi:ATP-dependent helicase HrpA/adenine-specific DNA-methyltransferase